MVNGSLDAGCRMKDLGLEGPGATMGGSADHVLVGVVVTYTRSGVSHFLNAWTTLISNGCHSSTNNSRKTLEEPFASWIQAPSVGCGASTMRSVEGVQISIRRYRVKKG